MLAPMFPPEFLSHKPQPCFFFRSRPNFTIGQSFFCHLSGWEVKFFCNLLLSVAAAGQRAWRFA
jgi:hypothetical protein